MHHFFIAQFVGVIAVILSLAMYQFNSRKIMLIFELLVDTCWTISFILLGAKTGVSMVAIGAVMAVVFLKVKPNKSNVWVLYTFLIIQIIATFLTWHGLSSLLALFGNMLITLAFWSTNTKSIRRLSLGATPLWFFYDIIVGSFPGATLEIMLFCSNIIGQYRFDFRKKKN